MKRENLVFLAYSSNTCYTQLSEGDEPKGCSVDLEKGVWTFGGGVFQIGMEMRHCDWGCYWGVIGVYDRSNLEHLKNLLYHSREAVRGPSRLDDD